MDSQETNYWLTEYSGNVWTETELLKGQFKLSPIGYFDADGDYIERKNGGIPAIVSSQWRKSAIKSHHLVPLTRSADGIFHTPDQIADLADFQV